MRSAAVAPLLARCAAAHASGVAAVPARSFFSSHVGATHAAARSVTAMAGVPAVSSASRRLFSSEPSIRRVKQEWEMDEGEVTVLDERGRKLTGERAQKYLEEQKEREEAARLEMERTRTELTFLEDKEKGSRDAEEIVKVLTKFGLADHAEKFFSMQNLLHIKVHELKEMGLTVKQRKTLLRAIGKYKLALRTRDANKLIQEQGSRMEPRALQQAVYNIMYKPLYAELDWRDARAPLIASWREQIAKYKLERLQDHSNLRGLREPELMELAKVEAHMMAETLKWKRAGYDKQSERFKEFELQEDGSPEEPDAEGNSAAVRGDFEVDTANEGESAADLELDPRVAKANKTKTSKDAEADEPDEEE